MGWAADNGGAALVIQDEGIGMSREALSRAESQVAAPVSIDVAAAERMGLVVVGHLAHRHGIQVEMRSGGRGMAVFVSFPSALIVEAPEGAPPWSPARWIRVEHDSTVETSEDESTSVPVKASRRGAPTRAEDVLGASRTDSDGDRDSVWWSRRPTAVPATPAAASSAVPDGAPSGSGLPMRVPMANLPQRDSAGAPTRPPTDPDPTEVGSVLSRFYGGVHRAELEDGSDLEAAGKSS
jgi:hypothetical protein